MKTYSIGRDNNCDIVINDTTDVISRRHALLNVTSSGKMTIIDQSSNGTYVNGIRITPNVPFPVTRKDMVSLAHIAKLDWTQVPKSNRLIYLISAAAAILVITGIVFSIIKSKPAPDNNPLTPVVAENTDSTAVKQKEAARLDSLKTAERQDSIKRAEEKERKDSVKAAEKPAKAKKDAIKSGKEDKSETEQDTNKSSQSKKRTIG